MDLSHNMCSVLYESPFIINQGGSFCCMWLRRRPSITLHHVAVHGDSASLEWLEWDIRGVSGLCLGLTHPSPQAKHTEIYSRQLTTNRSTQEEEVLNTPLVSDGSSSHWLSHLICSPPSVWPTLGRLIVNLGGSWVADFMANSVFPCCFLGALSQTCRHLAHCCVLYSGHLAGCWAAE